MNLRTLVPVVFLALSTAAFASACSTEEAGPKYGSAEAYCTDYGAEECKIVAPLCAIQQDTCAAKSKAKCLQVAAAAAGRTFNSPNGETCIAKTKETDQKRTITGDDLTALDAVCQKAFQGSVAKGGSCKNNYDCTGSLICDKTQCADKADKKLDDGCSNPGEVCEKGTVCTTVGEFKKCVAKRKSGETCGTAAQPCLEDLRCVVGTCGAKLNAGETCSTSDECSTGFCDPTAKKCSAGLTYATGTTACGAFQ